MLPYLIHLNDDLEAEYTDSENVRNQERQIVASLDALQGFVETVDSASRGDVSAERAARSVRDLTVGRPYMMSLDNQMSLVMVASAIPADDFETAPLLDKRIEALLEPLAVAHPEYRFERTGMTAIARDEMDSIGPETQMITLLALVLVFLVLVWSFRSFVTPLLTLVPILLGIIWSLGVIALTLGSMNLMTVMIMVVLLGLGVDFSIHLTSRFHEEIARNGSVEELLGLALAETGLGVVTGGVTTAVAFLALMVADTKGIEEFGFCAGVGVLTTLAAVLWILPALLASWGKRLLARGDRPQGRSSAWMGGIAEWVGRWRVAAIVFGIVATAAGGWAGRQLAWEWNFMELEPEGLRSIALQDEIIDRFKLSVTVAMLTAETPEESRALRKQLEDKRIIGEVDDISLWLSRPDLDQSLPFIRELRETAAVGKESLGFADGTSPAERRVRWAEELDRLWANMVEIQALAFTGGQDRVVEKTAQLVATRDSRESGLLRRVADGFAADEAIDWASLDRFSDTFSEGLRAQVARMARGEEPVTLDMVPADIAARYVSPTSAGYLMQTLPKQNLNQREELELFDEVAARVHPRVTGMPQMMLHMNRETIREGKLAFLAASLVILVVLLLDFRRPLIAVLAFLPLLSGIAYVLGILWLLGEKLNYINVIGLPVMIGIGVDDGVHFFHRFIQEGRGGMRRAVESVGRAMVLTSLTTMIGFGSLMLYLMRGMASLGLVLFLGVGMCLLVTFTLLPALASLFEAQILKQKR